MSETVIPGAFDDPNYKIKVFDIHENSSCDFCNRKEGLVAIVWWTQPETKPPASIHTFICICSDCVNEIRNKLLER